MGNQKQVPHPQKKKEEKAPEVKANPEITKKGKEIKKSTDDLLDKIDDILEENAEEFVKNYVQKGGE